MQKRKLGILHPGQMGSSVAASAQNSGCQVYWASQGRSPASHERAAKLGLHDAGSIAALCATCDVVVSVCPPHAAEDVAARVADCGFSGLYLDANAIAPRRAVEIGRTVTAAGATFVDGGIVGAPAWEPGTTWLYLSGGEAPAVAACFAAGPLETTILDPEIGQASALKMCYAAWTKGSTALLCAIVATATETGVWDALRVQWARDWPGFDEQTVGRIRRVTAKAWRFAGEMDEIAATLGAAGLPGGFHAAAADVYRRLAHLKDAEATPSLEEVLEAMVREDPTAPRRSPTGNGEN
jgi:3-hydroxyisobutyrate dehydrogenase-like beta-hydroxyacid dehydrogenase